MDVQRRGTVLRVAVDAGVAMLALAIGLSRDASRIPGWGSVTGSALEPHPYLLDPSPTVIVLSHLVGSLALFARRRHPYAVALFVGALSLVVPQIAAVFVTYAVARYGGRLWAVGTINVGLVCAMLVGGDLWGLVGSADWRRGDPYTVMLLCSTLTAFGLYARARLNLVEVLAERAELAEGEAAALAETARLRDGARLAVRLHDDVAHHLTVITMASGALALGATDEETRREAEQVRRSGAHALDALHAMIRTLSSGDVSTPAAVSELSDGLTPRDAGRRALLLETLGEGLVNADKHSPGAGITVQLTEPASPATGEVREGVYRLSVVNGASEQPPADAAGADLGLATLRARCAALGGHLEAGPTADGGWRLEVQVPAGAVARSAAGERIS